MPRPSSRASHCPTPRGNTIEGQLRLVFRQVMKNGAMGLDQAVFVGSHFGVNSVAMRKTFKEVCRGTALDEDEFLDMMHRAMESCGHLVDNMSGQVKPSVVNNTQAKLHKEMSLLPFVPSNQKQRRSISPTRSELPSLSESSPKTLRLRTSSGTKNACVSPSHGDSSGFDASFDSTASPKADRPSSRMSTAGKRRAASVPPMGTSPTSRPGSASYMRPFTPTFQSNSPSPWKWNLMDNNVPRNVRSVLLKPMRPLTRPPTPAVPDERTSQLIVRATDSLHGITRMEAIDAFMTATDEPELQNGLISLQGARNGLQTMGMNARVDDVKLLAIETKALEKDDKVKFHVLTSALIPVVQQLTVQDAGIHPEKFAKFKQQRLKFTRNLSTKEIKLLQILRDRLNQTCMGGASELRKSFKHFDTKGTGRSSLKQMMQALALQGIGMAPADAEVLYSILDPDGKEGMDYNEFTALMMPPDIQEAYRETVQLGYDYRESRSRAGMRQRQATKQSEMRKKKSAKPEPEAVIRFLRSLTTDQILQVLKNKVALALKAGPGAIRKLYQLFDKDGNNEIDEEELRDLLVDFGLSLSHKQIQLLLERLDRNQNGRLDQHEFVSALLPADHYSLAATKNDIKDVNAVGVSMHDGQLSGDDLREFLREKLLRTFVKKGDTSPGYQIREAISRFDANRDGSMSSYELRKAMNALGLYVDDDTIQTLIKCYDTGNTGSAEFLKFVEDIDPMAFNFAFSVGKVAKAGSFETTEKEAKLSSSDPDEKVRNSLKAALRQRMKMDGMSSVLKEIRAYGLKDGKMTRENFRAALLRLGLKIEREENLERAFHCFCDPDSPGESMDIYQFAAMADADFEMLPQTQSTPVEKRAQMRAQSRQEKRSGSSTDKRSGSSMEKGRGASVGKVQSEERVGSKTVSVVQPRPFNS